MTQLDPCACDCGCSNGVSFVGRRCLACGPGPVCRRRRGAAATTLEETYAEVGRLAALLTDALKYADWTHAPLLRKQIEEALANDASELGYVIAPSGRGKLT